MTQATGHGSRRGVCILTETFHPVTGGGETQARSLAEGLVAQGIEVHLVTRRSDGALARRESICGATVHRVGPSGGGHLRKWGLVFTALVALVRLRKRYDTMLVCGFRVLGIPAMLVSLASGKPCFLKADSQGELSGAFFDPGLATMRLRHDRFPVSLLVRLRNRLLRRAAGFVAISAVIEQEYLGHGVAPARIVRIPNSVDTSRFRPLEPGDRGPLRDRLGIPRDRRVVTYTGRLATPKGLPSLIRAWSRVAEAHPDALLLLVGSGGLSLQNCEDALRQQVGRLGLEDGVLFTGSVDNVHEYLQASDLFVFPTEREAFGISVIEAMACGLPVVTTGVDGIRDVVQPDVDAIVIPPRDDDRLAEAILRVLAGGEPILAMARAARRHAVERFSGEQVVAAYRELLAGPVRS
jgi:glycosyltransferase involved in cell wall biosynthesis